MSPQRQIFQTSSRLRWNTFRWVGRLILFFFLLMIPIVWIALARDHRPFLPGLSKIDTTKSPLTHPKGFTPKEEKKYRGFNAFLKVKQQNSLLAAVEKRKPVTSRIRAAFYVDWDPQALFSLESHISDLNMVMPEWFFIDPNADTLKVNFDFDAYDTMKQHGVKILPILNNVNLKSQGTFDPDLLDKVLLNPAKKQKLLTDIVAKLKYYNLQGINIDFEELHGHTIDAMHSFQQELYDTLHKNGLLVTQDIMPDNEDYHVKELARYNDYLFFMAYDQHYATSVPGPVSEQRWIEKEMDKIATDVPSEKIVLCMAAYGYDWPDGADAETITYQQALSLAKEFNATIDFDNDSYNCSFEYTDYQHIHHTVSFIDAGGNFNTMRFADEYSTAGVALWRLGSEDERIWDFYNRNLSNAALKKDPFDFSSISSIDMTTDKPDFKGDGEILDVKNEPQKGIIDIEKDSTENLVSEETYRQLPTRYFIKRFGQVKNQVILTFDDGPDPEYTPRILDILKKENVPAAFFIIGENAEAHLPLLKRIYREGFEIGNHTFTHPNIAAVSEGRAQTEMEATRLLIESATGRSTILFRAPYNADAEPTKAVELKPLMRSKLEGYYTVGESIDPDDWKPGMTADSIYNSIVDQYEARPDKGIILFHDAGGNREATVEALPRVIHYFKNKGVQFTTIANLLHLPKDIIMPPVNDNLVRMNSVVTTFLYWAGRLLFAAFWVAIVLGLIRIGSLAILALLQYFKTRKEKFLPITKAMGKVSIIIPAYNEEVNAVKTIKNLLSQNYADFEIIFVDDGSADNTYTIVKKTFGNNPKVMVLTKDNGGKASALNFGIAHCSGEYLVCIDADTQLLPDAVRQLMKYFNNPKVAAIAGNVKVGNQKNILTKWQSIEYTTAQNFDRRAFDYLNCITVIPGAIGAFRKTALLKAGGFTTDTLAEDCDLTLRILRDGNIIRNCTQAVAVTEVPETLPQFMKQRFRWSYGVMQSFWKNRDACFNPRYKFLGMVALPNILLFQILLPILAPIADFIFFLSIYLSWNDPASIHKILFYYSLFLLVDMSVSIMAFSFEREKIFRLVWVIPQRFVYRQLMYVVLFKSIVRAIKGENQNWGVLRRTGNVKVITPDTEISSGFVVIDTTKQN
ncbi:MAG TPA: glycosyltransferase [Chitinophagaceae bacterium]|nr:glycosyltransferase [Chitinophagaceae bacterium]